MSGVQTVYHVAADYRLWAPILPCSIAAKLTARAQSRGRRAGRHRRVVYTSTVGASASEGRQPGTEDTPVSLADRWMGRTKLQVPRRRVAWTSPSAGSACDRESLRARALGRQADADGRGVSCMKAR